MSYTLLEFPFNAQEGIGDPADLPTDIKVFGFTISEDFVQVELYNETNKATSV